MSMRILMGESLHYRGAIRAGSHAIADGFRARDHDVMWIGTPLYPHSLLRGHPDVKRRVEVWKRGGVTGPGGVVEYYPMTLTPPMDRPVLRSRWAVENALRLSVPRADTIVRRHGFGAPDLLWLSQSRTAWALMHSVKPARVAARLSDDWRHFRNVPAALVAAHEEIIRRADVVFATANRIREGVKRLRDNVVYLPNAVDGSFFVTGQPEPALLAGLPRPRIVYVGSLEWWIDMAAIEAINRALPGASLVLIGPGKLPGAAPPGTILPGAQPFDTIPAMLNHCDVAIIPFLRNDLTHAVSPVKLFEYLATGIPVVATSLEEIAAAGSPAILANSATDFADAVAGVATGTAPWDRAAAVSYARAHTWDRRMATIAGALEL